MIHIVGHGQIEQAQAFDDVRLALDFDVDVYLGAMWSKLVGLDLKNEVIYNMEPLYDNCPIFSIGYMEVLKNNYIIDYSRRNIEYLKKLGIDCFYMPYGWHEGLVRKVNSDKDIDVLFVGSTHHKRRIDILDNLSKYFNIEVAKGVYGKKLDNLISRAKLHINIHHVDNQDLEVVRLNYLIANGCNIVSEYGNDEEVNEKYEKCLTFSDKEKFVDSCHKAMGNPINGELQIKQNPHDCYFANKWAICKKRGLSCQQ